MTSTCLLKMTMKLVIYDAFSNLSKMMQTHVKYLYKHMTPLHTIIKVITIEIELGPCDLKEH